MRRHGDWFVERLEMLNFRCFDHLDLTFDPSLTVIVGENGAGKSAVLDGLAVMLSTIAGGFDGPTRGFYLRDVREVPADLDSQVEVANMSQQFPVEATATAVVEDQSHQWTRTRTYAKGRTRTVGAKEGIGNAISTAWTRANYGESEYRVLPVIAVYGVERLTGVRKKSRPIPRTRAGAYEAALDGQSDIARLSTYLSQLSLTVFQSQQRGQRASAAEAQIDAIALACEALLGETGWRQPEWNAIISEITLAHPVHGTQPLTSLSSGIKITAGLIIDLVSRAARANPHLGSKELLRTVPGIVLIDEVDLHLHPQWQHRILLQLREVFPLIQFIVTTHSPQVLSTVDGECIRILDGSQVHEVAYSAGLRSDIILKRVMGTAAVPSLTINDKLNSYVQMVAEGQGRSNDAIDLRRELDNELGGIANEPRLAEADATIAFDELDD